jgi:uncharacterized lipoprotein YmbA
VEVDVNRFDADPDLTLVLAARWTVKVPRSARDPLFRAERFTARPTGSGTEALLAAMSDLLGVLSDAIALTLAA